MRIDRHPALSTVAALTALSLLSACSLNPPLKKPSMPVPASYGGDNEAPGNGADLAWRSMLPDPRLQALVALALENNRDLRLAALNVAAVQAQYQVQSASELPRVDAGVSATRQRGVADEGSEVRTQVRESSNASLSINAFELDFFGRLRSQSEAAFSRYLASVEGQRAARMTLIAAVADAYLAQRLAEEQALLTRRTLADWRQSLDLTERLYGARQRSALDLAQARGQVATAEADLHARDRALRLAQNNLELLAGSALPAGLPAGLTLTAQPVLTDIPAGLPSDLLVRRPDIIEAEHALAAANADIGAARAAFFPRISLTAQLGFASPEVGGLFRGSRQSWSFAPQVTQPIFHGGQLRAELRLAQLRKSVAVAQYERVIQVAFREVSDALAGKQTYRQQLQAQQRVVKEASTRERLSRLRYDAGQDSRLELLDAQRQAYGAHSALLDLQREHQRSAIALYQALGGGSDR
ncbi:MAG: efflux transporter outer membrane subunit [Duganella sp.]